MQFRERAGGELWRLRGGRRADSRGFRQAGLRLFSVSYCVGFLQASLETASSAQRSCRTEVFPLVKASSTLISCTTPPSDWFCQDNWAQASPGTEGSYTRGQTERLQSQSQSYRDAVLTPPLPDIEPRLLPVGHSHAEQVVRRVPVYRQKTRRERRSHTRNKLCVRAKSV